jgi:hypothetical protein
MTDVEELLILNENWRPYTDPDLGTTFAIPPAVPVEIIPHPLAPLFSSGAEGLLTLKDLASDLASPNFTFTKESIELIRQASLVSLYFFLKYVAGSFGPYSDLTDHLHVDICNFRQRQLQAGSRAAIFLPRSMFKSTVGTHGGGSWELIRDPNLQIGLCASNVEMAGMFMSPIAATFSDNPLMEVIFPEHCARKGEKGNIIEKTWNSHEIILPSRTLALPAPSVKCMGAGGSSAGNHFDLLTVDDLVSEKELDSDRNAGSDMLKKGNWFSSNQDTLLVTPRKSRVFLAATRYAVDDPYESMFTEVKSMHGYWDELPYEVNTETGIWDIYYRMAIEQDKPIFPEKVNALELDRMRKKDPWKYFTQYQNNPYAASVSELASYNIRDCAVDFDNYDGYQIIFWDGMQNVNVPLAECEVTIGLDPAASETRVSKRTSQSAIVVRARDCQDRRFYIDGSVGYYAPTKIYDEIFRLYRKWRAYIRSTNIEAHGGFKIIWNSLLEEQVKRQTFIGLRRIKPLPDKDAKLREFIQPLLEFNKIYAASNIIEKIREEVTIFPGGVKRDVMDAMEIADRDSVKPLSPGEAESFQRRRRTSGNRAGY